jgi:hypothetical protein
VNGFGRGVVVLFGLDMAQAGEYAIIKWEKECKEMFVTVDSQLE